MTRCRSLQTPILLTLALSLQVCGGGGNSNTDPGPTVPVPVPTPSPEPTPVAEASLSASCDALGEGVPEADAVCTDGPPHFLDEMNRAIERVRSEHPGYFDGRRVLNVGAYYVEVIRNLDKMGLCAASDGGEVGVKLTDDFNDQFDILTGKDEYRTGENIYIGSCAPAIFPRGGRPPWPVPDHCSLPASDFVACGRPESRYYGHVEAAIDQMLEEHPELFDHSDRATGTNWPRITDPKAYQFGVVGILADKGYCAIFDGEEITMKRTNEFSEHYDINVADNYVRRGYGIYRGACYPSAF